MNKRQSFTSLLYLRNKDGHFFLIYLCKYIGNVYYYQNTHKNNTTFRVHIIQGMPPHSSPEVQGGEKKMPATKQLQNVSKGQLNSE